MPAKNRLIIELSAESGFWGLSYERSINTVYHSHLAVLVLFFFYMPITYRPLGGQKLVQDRHNISTYKNLELSEQSITC